MPSLIIIRAPSLSAGTSAFKMHTESASDQSCRMCRNMYISATVGCGVKKLWITKVIRFCRSGLEETARRPDFMASVLMSCTMKLASGQMGASALQVWPEDPPTYRCQYLV